MSNLRPQPIDRFIAATRTNYPKRIDAKKYQTTIARLEFVAKQLNLPIMVKIVFSNSRKIEYITVSDAIWIIYDANMGRSLDVLNRIFIEAKDGRPAITYFHKVLAEHLLETSRYDEALGAALVYKEGLDSLPSGEEKKELCWYFTDTHEKFMLYHEFGHCIQTSKPSFPVKRDHVRFLLAREVESNSRSLDELTRDFHEAHPATHHYEEPAKALQDMREQYESFEGTQFRKAMLAALAEPQTEEEVFCDIFAADYCLSEAKLDDIDIAIVLRAIYIGFYHLQSMEYLRRAPSLTTATVDWRTDNVPKVMVRSHCLKAHLNFMFQAELQNEKKSSDDDISQRSREFEIQLMEDQQRHYRLIYDRAIALSEHFSKKSEKNGVAGKSMDPASPTSLPDSLPENMVKAFALAITSLGEDIAFE